MTAHDKELCPHTHRRHKSKQKLSCPLNSDEDMTETKAYCMPIIIIFQILLYAFGQKGQSVASVPTRNLIG